MTALAEPFAVSARLHSIEYVPQDVESSIGKPSLESQPQAAMLNHVAHSPQFADSATSLGSAQGHVLCIKFNFNIHVLPNGPLSEA